MKVDVVSEDGSLLALCRETAREYPDHAWTVSFAASQAADSDADLCLYDYQPGGVMFDSPKWAVRRFALVGPRDLEAFRSAYPYADAAIILKPVTRAVIRALLAQAIANSANGASREDDSVRSDRDEILQCLMGANLRLQQYDLERTNFLGRALHDFHAPLTALSGYCGLLSEQSIGTLNEEQRLIIGRMHHSIRRLSRMSRAMFQLSVGRHVHLQPILRESDIRDCAEQALYEIQQIAQEKDIQIDVDLEPPSRPLLIDPDQMEQVIVNLLENACKFSPRSGSIEVKGYHCFWDRRAANVLAPTDSERRSRNERHSNTYRIDIRDLGPGIHPEHISSIFEEYVSYSGGQDRSRGGLGLAICRMILNHHKGGIWAENREAGAVFSFVLPLNTGNGSRSVPQVALSMGQSDLSRV